MKTQLRAYRPGNNDYVILPHPISFQASLVLSETGTMQLTYPLDGVHVDALDPEPGGVFAGVDVELWVWDGSAWVLPPQGRFELTDVEIDAVAETESPVRTYTFQSWSARPLWSVRQATFTGLNKNNQRVFTGQSIAQVAVVLIGEAKGRGDVPDLSVQNLAGTGGDAPALEPGQTLAALLENGRDEGKLEWLMQPDGTGQGRKLVFYSTVGADLSATVDLRMGLDFKQSPSHWSSRDMAAAAIVQGDNNSYVVVAGSGPTGPYGNNMDYVTASGVTDPAGLTLIGDSRVLRGSNPRVEHTRDLILDHARFIPFVDYSLGDTVLAPDARGEMVPLRVRQITLTFDENGHGANLVLGDRFTERVLQIERATRGITGNAGALGGGGDLPIPNVDGGNINAGTIPPSAVEVGFLNAFTITADYVHAGAIDGQTITGVTLRTSSFGARVVISGSAYNSSPAVALYDSSGGSAGIFSSPSGRVTIGTTSEHIAVNPASGAVGVYAGGSNIVVWNSNGVFSPGIGTNTSSNAANVVISTTSPYTMRMSTSLSRQKLAQLPIPVRYQILDLPSKSWIDKGEYEDNPDKATRIAGFIAEDLKELSDLNDGAFESVLSYDDDGDLVSIKYDRIPAFLIPVLKDMHERISELENTDDA